VTAEHEIVLFGATGFTGGLVADYLAGHAELGAGRGWALAGRNLDRLRAVRDRLTRIDPALAELELIWADATDPASLRQVAESARVVASTVGPFIRHGEPLVAACAAAGTDYVDITGEPEFVDLMYVRHHAQALRTGARLVHACGFDSTPHDLGALFTIGQLPEGEPLSVEGYVSAGGTISGGTYHSALDAFSHLRQTRAVAAERRRLQGDADPIAPGRRVRGIVRAPHREPIVGAGTLAVLAQIPPALGLLRRFKEPGEGPDEQRRERSWFRIRFTGRVGSDSEPRVVCEVRGGDPGYGETAKFLGEAALCLARDELPATAGQVTTAVGMGEALIARLTRAGIVFERVRS
jgi:short subunit dehydrogenase-like uncharacterized protein